MNHSLHGSAYGSGNIGKYGWFMFFFPQMCVLPGSKLLDIEFRSRFFEPLVAALQKCPTPSDSDSRVCWWNVDELCGIVGFGHDSQTFRHVTSIISGTPSFETAELNDLHYYFFKDRSYEIIENQRKPMY